MNETWFPEAVRPRRYSFRGDLKLNVWALVAVVFAAMARWLLQHHHEWGALLRTVVALTPILPSLLYARSIGRWLDGLDELQRRIQLQAWLVATSGTILIATALSLLESVGVVWSPRLQHGLGWEGTFAVVILLYVIANILVNRRYR